jgi:hypothetical protein
MSSLLDTVEITKTNPAIDARMLAELEALMRARRDC